MLKWNVSIGDLFKSDSKAIEVSQVEALRAIADQAKLTNNLLDLLVGRAIEVKDGDKVNNDDETNPDLRNQDDLVDGPSPHLGTQGDVPTMPFIDPKKLRGISP